VSDVQWGAAPTMPFVKSMVIIQSHCNILLFATSLPILSFPAFLQQQHCKIQS
jgi:hypothetical protein